VLGIMWHPERENPFDEQDRLLVERHLTRGDAR
jgi:hypothetical protein